MVLFFVHKKALFEQGWFLLWFCYQSDMNGQID